MAKLKTYVHVVELDDKGNPTSRQDTFGPDDHVPDWALASITNPDVWDEPPSEIPEWPSAGGRGDAEQRATAAEQRADAAEAELEKLRQQIGASEQVAEPPRGGPGSGADAWRTFLTGQGVEDLPDNASREDLVALWDARKIQG
jgi:hypothetical protein